LPLVNVLPIGEGLELEVVVVVVMVAVVVKWLVVEVDEDNTPSGLKKANLTFLKYIKNNKE